jgi:putative tryptophan/tyrosine transport system substrate-binding protein
VAIEYRWAEGHHDRLPSLAAELVRNEVAVIVAAGGAASALAAKAATSTIPIVVTFGADPVKLGLVASLSRPGGNITGVTFLATELVGKRLDLLRALVPQATTIAFLSQTQDPTAAAQESDIVAAARAMRGQIIDLEIRSDQDFEPAFANAVERGVGAIVVGTYPLFSLNRDRLSALAGHHKIPAIYPNREYVLAGGLISYGPSILDTYRLGGVYVGQILRGAKPADLPFQQSTKIEFVINMKTAKALGLTIPPTLFALADEVIE